MQLPKVGEKKNKKKQGSTCEVDIRGGQKCEFEEMKETSCRRKREIPQEKMKEVWRVGLGDMGAGG